MIYSENLLIKYLESGVTFIVSPGLVSDVLSANESIIGNLIVLTEGEWAWPSDLAYYITMYHVSIDLEFFNHAKANGWSVPKIENEALLNFHF